MLILWHLPSFIVFATIANVLEIHIACLIGFALINSDLRAKNIVSIEQPITRRRNHSRYQKGHQMSVAKVLMTYTCLHEAV